MPERVLVTGGAGFIGSHVADRLLDLGVFDEPLEGGVLAARRPGALAAPSRALVSCSGAAASRPRSRPPR